FKLKDKYASKDDITKKDKSVISKKTIAQVEKTTTNFYGSKRVKDTTSKSKKENVLNERADVKAASLRNKKEKQKKNNSSDELIDKGKDAKFPDKVSPMLATLVSKPFDETGWLYEVKWDGYRALALCNKDKVELRSRNNKSFNEKFYPVHKAVQQWNINAVIDGEVVVLDKSGKSNFGSLQNWRSEADGEIYFYIFDLLWLNGKNYMHLPLTDRRELLNEIVPKDGIIRLSENYSASGIEFFEAAKKLGLEGIIAKKAESLYTPGARTDQWLKIKANKKQEVIIGGYTKNENTSKEFSSLLVGVYDKGKIIYTGKIGTGFNDKQQKEMLAAFKPYIIKDPPFTEIPDINKPSRFRPNPPNAKAVWLKPELVCEVSFTEMTTDGVMRHPSFEGMRTDKKAKDVANEKAVETKDVTETSKKITKKSSKKSSQKLSRTTPQKILKPSGKAERKTLLNPADEMQVRKINGHELKFTNLSKIFWPDEGITKRDMLNYYYQAAQYILPYLKDRPQSLNRHPNGINGESFYQKDVTGKVPGWVKTYLYHSDADARDKHFMVADEEASLLYMASLACIEMNPWSSRINKPNHPDWCIIDLDPAENTFEQVIEAARVTHKILSDLMVDCYAKTSGSTGIHIYIPLGAKYTYEQSKEFARFIATMVHNELPEFTSIERAVKSRKGKMYIDFLQNRPQATLAAPYSLRPKPGATVSTPLHWEEVKKGLKMKDFTIHNAIARMKKEGDIFKPVLSKGINLEKILKKLK
ncbi:MAG: DNA ligase D, partial [Ignavibacteria bacterium]